MSTCFQNLFHCSQWTDVESTSKERKWTCGGLHLKAWLLINVCSIIFIFQICGNSIAPFKICWGTIGNFEDPVVTEFCFTWKYLIYFIKRFRSSLDWPSKRAATASDSAVTKNKKYIIYIIYIFMNDIRRQDTRFGALLEVEIMKLHVVVARSTFRSQHVKAPRAQITFGSSDVASCGRSKGFCTFLKVSKTWGFCSSAKRHVHQRC